MVKKAVTGDEFCDSGGALLHVEGVREQCRNTTTDNLLTVGELWCYGQLVTTPGERMRPNLIVKQASAPPDE